MRQELLILKSLLDFISPLLRPNPVCTRGTGLVRKPQGAPGCRPLVMVICPPVSLGPTYSPDLPDSTHLGQLLLIGPFPCLVVAPHVASLLAAIFLTNRVCYSAQVSLSRQMAGSPAAPSSATVLPPLEAGLPPGCPVLLGHVLYPHQEGKSQENHSSPHAPVQEWGRPHQNASCSEPWEPISIWGPCSALPWDTEQKRLWSPLTYP